VELENPEIYAGHDSALRELLNRAYVQGLLSER
jgi:hypothetical protein